jgi:hypothetical protein
MKIRFLISALLIIFTTLIQANSVTISKSTINLGETTTVQAIGYNSSDSFIWKGGMHYQEIFSDEDIFHFEPNIAGTYTLMLMVNGNNEHNVTIEVNPTPPEINIEAGSNQTICLGEYAELQATAPANTKLEWKIADDKYADGATFYFYPDTIGVYTIDLFGNQEQDSLIVTVNNCDNNDTNTAPIANAGVDQTITTGGMVQLNGSASSDVDNDSLTYSWSFLSKPTNSSATISDNSLVNPTFTADINGTYTIQLIVNDGELDSNSDSVVITVSNQVVLKNPIAVAKVNESNITEGVTVTFDGNSSYDTDGTILSYEWRENGAVLSTNKIFSLNNLTVGVHTITLKVMDDDGLIGTDSVVVTVKKLTNQGISFHTAFMSNFDSQTTLSFFISTKEDTTGKITLYDTNETIDFSVLAGDIKEVIIPIRMMLNGTNKEKKMIGITSQKDIVVIGLSRRQYTTDAYLVLPDKMLSTNYYALTYGNNSSNNSGQEELAIVATENNTVVHVNLANGLGSFDINLSKGETYQYQKDEAGSWLTGSHITSNKKVALLGGNSCVNIPEDQDVVACDHIVEQILPTNTWEKEFITVPLKTRKNGDTFRVLASENNTTVEINGTVVSTLTRGEYYETILKSSSYIKANNPILVAQYSNSSSYDGVTSDPFMALVPALNQFDTEHIINTPSGFTDYINIVVPTIGINDVELDGLDIDASEFSVVQGTLYSSAQIQISGGKHTLTSNEKIGLLGYGYASYDSYGYPSSLRLIRH